jgi:hypothetical protein
VSIDLELISSEFKKAPFRSRREKLTPEEDERSERH